MELSHYNTPRNRLALTYLGIIMVLSISFSALFYRESSHQATAGFRGQVTQLRDNLYFAPPARLQQIRDAGVDRFNHSLLTRLIYLNLIMLAGGAWLSYLLAVRSLKPMEEAMDAQSRFTSDAAHELRTPLTAMKTEIEVALRAKKLLASESRELLTSNLEEISKLEALTEALLRLAKNSHQPDPDSWKDVKLTDVFSAAAGRVAQAAKERGITFALPLPSTEKLRADYDQLVELFVILFDNAVKYGKDQSAVTVEAMKNDESYVIKVTDQGSGIKKADLHHIFDRFYRADASRNKTTTGYGLGLSVADAIVKSHAGTISAHSKVGTGTTFVVTLPRRQNAVS